jgi:hypothetical protein
MKIKTIYFRCGEDAADAFDGGNQRNWFGESSYSVGEGIGKNHSLITEIRVGNIDYGNTEFAEIFVEDKLWCGIHKNSICRIYYDMDEA